MSEYRKHLNRDPARKKIRDDMAHIYRAMRRDGKGSLARKMFVIQRKGVRELQEKLFGGLI